MTSVTCGSETMCLRLTERLVETGRKGFRVLTIVNMVTGDSKFYGVTYHTSAQDVGLLLNVCPWCLGKPGSFLNKEEHNDGND